MDLELDNAVGVGTEMEVDNGIGRGHINMARRNSDIALMLMMLLVLLISVLLVS